MKEENYESEEYKMPLAEWNKMKRLLRTNYKP